MAPNDTAVEVFATGISKNAIRSGS